jgi:hypothetical protein
LIESIKPVPESVRKVAELLGLSRVCANGVSNGVYYRVCNLLATRRGYVDA